LAAAALLRRRLEEGRRPARNSAAFAFFLRHGLPLHQLFADVAIAASRVNSYPWTAQRTTWPL